MRYWAREDKMEDEMEDEIEDERKMCIQHIKSEQARKGVNDRC